MFLSTLLSPEYNESNSLKQVSAMHSCVYDFKMHFLFMFSDVKLKLVASITSLPGNSLARSIRREGAEKDCECNHSKHCFYLSE